MYNQIAGHYATADSFGSISQSQNIAIAQIKREKIGIKPHYKVLDFGVGCGAFLAQLRQVIPKADFTGIDISPEMLNYARMALPLTTIEASAMEAINYLPHNSQDLVLAHFINAYISIYTLFAEAQLLTRDNGYFSLVTTTYESFPIAQEYLAKFIAKSSFLSTVVGHYYKTVLKNNTVASGLSELMHIFEQHQFNIIRHERLYIPIILRNLDELIQFSIEGTWFLNTLTLRMLPKNFLLRRLKRIYRRIFTFPFHDTHIIDVILAKKVPRI